MKTLTIRSLLLTVSPVLLAGGATAQREAAEFSLAYGVGDFGGRYAAEAYAESVQLENDGWRKGLGASLSSHVEMFGNTRSMRLFAAAGRRCTVDVIRMSRSITYTNSLGAGIQINGSTVWSTSDAASTNVYYNLAPYDLFGGAGGTRYVAFGPLTVAIRYNAEARATTSVTPSYELTLGYVWPRGSNVPVPVLSGRVGLNGTLRARATGTASGSVGVVGASLSVTSQLTFADTTVTLDLGATGSGLDGMLSWSTTPVRMLLRLAATLGFWSDTLTLVDHTSPAVSGSEPIR